MDSLYNSLMGAAVNWKVISLVGFGLLGAMLSLNASGHGGVYLEEDLCVIQVGYLKAHFTIFQPRTRRYQEFCEDLPDVTESVFVLEYAHDGLSNTPLEFRVIRNVTGLGRFARWSDVAKIEDIEQATVFHKPASPEPDIFMQLHEFQEAGNYVGIVTAVEPTSGEVIRAVFPFEVGFAVGFGYWPLVIAVLVLLQANYWWLRRRALSAANAGATLALLALTVLPTLASADATESLPSQVIGSFRVGLKSQRVPIPANQIHSWVVRVTTLKGEPVTDAHITVAGGMPAHDHGFPTSPKVTRYLGQGDYLIEGMKFHMRGSWELVLHITQAGETQVAIFQLIL